MEFWQQGLQVFYAWGVTTRISTEQLLRDLTELRRAARATTDPAVQARLSRVERSLRTTLGVSVPKTAAARALGISLTGLERWVACGLVPVVRSPGSSRLQPESGPLLELLEQVVVLREQGRRGRLVATALQRLGRRPSGAGPCVLSAELAALPRPNAPVSELRAAFETSTPLDRLGTVAQLSEGLTRLSGLPSAA